MNGRYLGALALFAGVLAFAAAVLAALIPGVAAWQLIVPALVAYALGTYFDLLPPGRPPKAAPDIHSAHTPPAETIPLAGSYGERPPLPPVLVPGPRVKAQRPGAGGPVHYTVEEPPPQRGLAATLIVGAIGLSLAAGAAAAWLVASRDGEADPSSGAGDISPTATAGAAAATQSPTAGATATAVATSTPTPTATATTPPPTPTPVQRAQPTPVPPTATRTPIPEPRPAGSLSGRWEIVDTVTYGPGANESYTFVVQLRQTGSALGGSGGGLELTGERQGDRVVVSFERPGGAGFFIWVVQGSDLLAGTFRDNGAANGGSSVARRLD